MLKHLFPSLLFGLAWAGAQEEAPDLRLAYDVEAYDLALDIDPQAQRIAGSVTVHGTVLATELTHVQLDLDDALEVERVIQGEKEIGFAHVGAELLVQVLEPLAQGDTFAVRIEYAGTPDPAGSFTGFHWTETAGGKPWINTSCQSIGAHTWWPCKASYFHAWDKPERMRIDLTVPEELYAVSNGRLVEIEESAGKRTFHWVHEYPLETYTVTLNVGPYVVVEQELELEGIDGKVPFIYYVLPEDVEKAAVQFAEVPELLAIYSAAFGPWPFPKSKFGLVQTNFWGMEHSTAVAYGSSFPAWCRANGEHDRYAARNRLFDYILVHEVAHEWWGNAVSAEDWGDLWLHEGFGTYAEGVYVERTQGREAADTFYARQSRRLGKRSRLYRGEGVDSGTAFRGNIVYGKGSAVLNTLRHFVADDAAWWRALREFNLKFRYGNASTEDFRAVLEEVTEREWKQFFEEFVYGEGYPSLTGKVAIEGKRIRVNLENTGSGANGFHLPLDLTWQEGEATVEKRLWIPPGRFEHAIDCGSAPTAVAVQNLRRLLGRHEVEVL